MIASNKKVDYLTGIRTKSGDVPDNSEQLGDGTEITAKLGDSTDSTIPHALLVLH